jgi:UDP-N-acetylmuramoyl-tripeptide--D-alanyl-D-alanine ligase
MRGTGQIAELAEIAEPDVGVIVNVGPVHLELLRTLEAIAAAKAELIAGLAAGGTAVVPAGEPLLEAHRRADVDWVTFGPGGDVSLLMATDGHATLSTPEGPVSLELPFRQAHQVANTLAAWAAARACGVVVTGEIAVSFSGLRGEEIALPGGIVVVNDCYNANPMSTRAALDHLAVTAPGRRVAVLGDMLELGPGERAFHEEIGAHAAEAGVDVLVTVGPLAAAMGPAFGGPTHAVADAAEAAALVPDLLEPGDTVLVKGSRGVGLEVVAEALQAQVARR